MHRGGGGGGRGGGRFGGRFRHQRQRPQQQYNHRQQQQQQHPNNNRQRRWGDGASADETIIEVISPQSSSSQKNATTGVVRIAVEGCCHGELEAIYSRLQKHERETFESFHQQKEQPGPLLPPPIDLLLCCGDMQTLRNLADFHSIAIPPKYRSMGSFYKYYSGELVAPYLTIFVSGNHEASQALHELYYGGWVAPNIYYLGAAGVVNFAGLRIGGIGGIYKSHDYSLGRHEKPPYDHSSLRSIYHVRNLDVYRMLCLSSSLLANKSNSPINHQMQHPKRRLDVMISHDWPQGIEQHGDTNNLIRRKPFFQTEIEQNCLGSPPNRKLLDALKPQWWFAAHLHVKFRATVVHSSHNNNDDVHQAEEISDNMPTSTTAAAPDTRKRKASEATIPLPTETNEDNISMGDDDNDNGDDGQKEATQFVAPAEAKQSCATCDTGDLTDQMTQFLSLDKCLPRRHYLTIVDIPIDQPRLENPKLEYDLEWLAILRKTHHWSNTSPHRVSVPDELVTIDDQDLHWIRERLPSMQIPENFVPTVPAIADGVSMESIPKTLPPPLRQMGNPQTDAFLQLLELPHIITIPYTGNDRP